MTGFSLSSVGSEVSTWTPQPASHDSHWLSHGKEAAVPALQRGRKSTQKSPTAWVVSISSAFDASYSEVGSFRTGVWETRLDLMLVDRFGICLQAERPSGLTQKTTTLLHCDPTASKEKYRTQAMLTRGMVTAMYSNGWLPS